MASDLVKSLVATGVRDGLNRRSSVGGSFVEPPLLPPEGPVAFGARGGASGNTNNGNNRFTPKGLNLVPYIILSFDFAPPPLPMH